jgi:hypothetical protein
MGPSVRVKCKRDGLRRRGGGEGGKIRERREGDIHQRVLCSRVLSGSLLFLLFQALNSLILILSPRHLSSFCVERKREEASGKKQKSCWAGRHSFPFKKQSTRIIIIISPALTYSKAERDREATAQKRKKEESFYLC